MAVTPPPPEVHTPTAPLHGPMFDAPHISNRKSDRIRNQKRADRTPSPSLNTSSFDSEAPGELKRTPKAKRSSHHPSSRSTTRRNLSPPSSPLDSDSAMAPKTRSKQANYSGLLAPAKGSLPTPMKTPRKQILHPDTAEAARVLFPNGDEAQRAPLEFASPSIRQDLTHLPTPLSKKRGKRTRKNVGFSLDDELERATGGQSGDIEIYTDSREMIPEVDDSSENPFYVRPGEPKKKYPKREIKPKQAQNVERGLQMLNEDRGFFAVGRGRRFWKSIDEKHDPELQSPCLDEVERQFCVEDMDEGVDDGTYASPEPNASQFTRRSLRPRRLFMQDSGDIAKNGSHADGPTDDDAEAVTDIEEPEKHGLAAEGKLQTETSTEAKHVTHSEATNGGEGHEALESQTTATKKAVDHKTSPFNTWRRLKSSRSLGGDQHGEDISPAATSKREGEPLGPSSKRVRGSQQ